MEDIIQTGNPQPQEGGEGSTVEQLLAKIEELQLNSVPKDKYEKILEDNKKLVDKITNERPAPKGTEATPQDILKRMQERSKNIANGGSHEAIKILVENHRDMQRLGMDTSNVDEDTVSFLEGLLKEANGDSKMFQALMESRVRIK